MYYLLISCDKSTSFYFHSDLRIPSLFFHFATFLFLFQLCKCQHILINPVVLIWRALDDLVTTNLGVHWVHQLYMCLTQPIRVLVLDLSNLISWTSMHLLIVLPSTSSIWRMRETTSFINWLLHRAGRLKSTRLVNPFRRNCLLGLFS